jgi:hypothetical protein
MRKLTCLLIVAGAFASIATSQVPPAWTLSQRGDLTAAVIDNQTPSVRFLVHTELHGAEPIPTLDGVLEANVLVSAQTMATGSATIELHSLTHPDVMPVTHTVGLNNKFSDYLSLDQWLACDVDPCIEEFEIVVQRDASADLPPLDVSGYVQTMAWGKQGPMPAGAALDVTVTAE